MAIYAKRRIKLGITALVGLLFCAPLAAQSDKPAAAASTASSKTWRTPWGDPDLQGSWTNATSYAPLERPDRYGTRQFLTAEERAEQEQRRRSSDIRGATPEEDAAAGYNQFWFEGRTNDGRTSLITDPADGKIPFTPEGRKRRTAFADTQRTDSYENRSWYDRCVIRLPLPRIPTAYNNNYEIVQTPGFVAILQEQIHETRVIPLDRRPHLNPKVRQWLGDSRGWWEGNTLVVETTNFSDRTSFQGSTPNMRLTERWTRLADDRIDYSFTVEDPAAWTGPWSAAIAWNKVGPLYEYACHEGNYGLFDILEGARIKEAKEAEERKKSGR